MSRFARDVLGRPFDEWQEWLVLHGGELLPDGRPRFRTVLVLVARQQGKTEVCVILSLYWLFVELVSLVLGTSTNLAYAKESFDKAVDLAESIPELAAEISRVRRAAGEESLITTGRCRYRIAASNRKGGRSLTIKRLIADELREHHDWSAWNAAVPAMSALADAQAWCITNQGDDKSVVLDSLRSTALETLKTGQGDMRLGLFEWSAPDGSKPTDPAALAYANPNLGRRTDLDSLLGDATRAEAKGGEELSGFLTEYLCMRVRMLEAAIDPARWVECMDPGDLSEVKDRVALCVDVSIDGLHATLTAAAVLPEGRVRVEPLHTWTGRGCGQQMGREIGGLVAKIKPQAFGWIPNGPAAAVAASLADRGKSGSETWPPRDVKVEEIRSEVTAVCMGFADLVEAKQVAHSDDPLLNAHVAAAEKLRQGDSWRFTRRGAGHVDGVYAAAGAVHLARTLPPPIRPRVRWITG